ncbi:alpha 1,2 mannosyltransferase [Podila minutissima]|nr:alpha 1,2 mannosyltransferase [Podila minutissima]
MQMYRPFSKATWCIYLFLLSIRTLIAFSPGYIHPDEYFQSAEVTAGRVFGFDVNIPWEYKPELPCRSILVPSITTGIPFLFLKAWLGSNTDYYATTRAIFVTQRLAFLLITLVIDAAFVRMARQIKRSPSIALLLVSSSYVTLAYHTHPFSNTVETLVLTLSAAVLSNIIHDHDTHERVTPAGMSFLLGVLFAVGVFTRITFVLFGFPFGVMFLYLNWKVIRPEHRSWIKCVRNFVFACLPLALGIGIMSFVAIVVDSIFFEKLLLFNKTNGAPILFLELFNPKTWAHLGIKGSITVTMLNNLVYNMDSANLAQHGLHPRFFHLFLNYPVLFGNLAYLATKTMIQKARLGEWTSQSKLVTALTYAGISGIGLLSVMPHQEARFLTPLILPLVITLSGRISRLGRKFWPLWLLYNGIMAIVFGVIHQARLVPAMDLIQHQSLGFQHCKPKGEHSLCLIYPSEAGKHHIYDGGNYTTHVVFYKTYMPPHHLFGYSSKMAQVRGTALQISDWRQLERSELLEALRREPQVDQSILSKAQEMNDKQVVVFKRDGISYHRTVLVAPSTVDFSDEPFYETRESFAPHGNFDHMDIILQRPLSSYHMNVFYI